MIELEINEYDRVDPLSRGMEHHLAVRAILAGLTSARVFADHRTDPRVALLWNKYRCYLAGAPDATDVEAMLRPLFSNVIVPQAVAMGAEVLVFYCDPESWLERLSTLLPDKRVMAVPRQYYALGARPRDWRSLLPAGYALHTVDAAFVYGSDWRNRERLTDEMCSERSSIADFLAQSFGVCLTYEDEIAGWCLSEYNFADRCEVGIEMIETHQRRGLATVMTLALCEQAFARGITQVGWDCWTRNVASGATARKAGFTLACDYRAGLAWLQEE